MKKLLLLPLLLCFLTACPAPHDTAPPTDPQAQASAPQLGWVADASATPIPDVPPQGSLAGQSFEVETATLENGILELRQGEEFFPDRGVTLFLFAEEGHVPSSQSYLVGPEPEFGAITPHVHMKWTVEGQSMAETEILTQDYTLRLVLGELRGDDTIPYELYLSLPDAHKSWVAGQGVAQIKGFRLVDGKVDPTQDAFQVLTHLARQHLGEGQEVEIIESYKGVFTHPDPNAGKPQTGIKEVSYKVAGGGLQHAKVLFLKGEQGWAVSRTLSMEQLPEARPESEPAPDDVREWVTLVSARWLEEHIASERPGVGVVNGQFNPSHRDEWATCQIRFRYLGEDKQTTMKLVVRKTDGAWTVDRPLAEGETLDFKSGEITSE